MEQLKVFGSIVVVLFSFQKPPLDHCSSTLIIPSSMRLVHSFTIWVHHADLCFLVSWPIQSKEDVLSPFWRHRFLALILNMNQFNIGIPSNVLFNKSTRTYQLHKCLPYFATRGILLIPPLIHPPPSEALLHWRGSKRGKPTSTKDTSVLHEIL